MPTFEIDNNGKSYEVDAPDMSTAVNALKSYTPQQDSGITADNLVRSAAQGVPILGGAVDKFAAGMDALTQPLLGRGSSAATLGERYSQNAAQEQAKTQGFDQAHPIASTLSGLAGGTAAVGGAIKAVPAIGSAMGFGGGSLIPNMAKGAATGSAIGAADAAVRGQDPTSGAEWGGAFGAAGPPIGRAIGAVAGKFSKPVSSIDTAATNQVAPALKNAGVNTPADLEAALRAVGPEAAPVDLAPELTSKGGAIAASPGEGQQIMRDFVKQRAAGAGDRVTTDINDVMGKPVDIGTLADKIYTDAKAQASPLFKDAYNTPIQGSPQLDAALNTPFGKAALAKAKTLGLSEPNAPPSAMFGSRPQAAPLPDLAQGIMSKGGPGAEKLQAALEKAGYTSQSPTSGVDVRGLHLTRQALDDMIQPAIRAGQTKKAEVLQGLRSTIDQTLKSVPSMAQADSIYSSQAAVREAMGNGLKIFRNNQTPQDIAGAIAGMSGAEKEAFQQGARAAIRNAMGTARNDAGAAVKIFQNEYNPEKLRLIVGDEGAAKIMRRINAEKTYSDIANRITGNSETAARAFSKADLANAHGLPSYRDAAIFSGVHGVVHRVIAGVVKSAYEAIASGRQKDIETSVAKLLTLKGVDRAEALNQLMGVAVKSDPTGKTNRLIAQVVARLPRPSDDYANRKSPPPQISGLSR